MKNKKIIIQILLFLIIFSHLILAIDSGEEIKKQIGVNPNDVTTDVNKMKSDYLKQQWTDFIAQNKVTKPIRMVGEEFEEGVEKVAERFEKKLTLK